MKNFTPLVVAAAMLLGCASTDIQPMTKSSFKVATHAAPACGPHGARQVANQAAAIEVINRGGDKFIFASDQSSSRPVGGGHHANDQDMIVQMVSPGDPRINEALSAREILGVRWKEKIAKGFPSTCAD